MPGWFGEPRGVSTSHLLATFPLRYEACGHAYAGPARSRRRWDRSATRSADAIVCRTVNDLLGSDCALLLRRGQQGIAIPGKIRIVVPEVFGNVAVAGFPHFS